MSKPKFKIGDIVKHKVYGVGQVRNVDSCGDYDVVCGDKQGLIACKEKYLVPFFLQENEDDMVNSPAHYTAGKIECIDALEAATTGLNGIEAVCVANAIKYLWRHKYKNGVEDCKKAVWYINRLIAHYEEQGNEKDLR